MVDMFDMCTLYTNALVYFMDLHDRRDRLTLYIERANLMPGKYNVRNIRSYLYFW